MIGWKSYEFHHFGNETKLVGITWILSNNWEGITERVIKGPLLYQQWLVRAIIGLEFHPKVLYSNLESGKNSSGRERTTQTNKVEYKCAQVPRFKLVTDKIDGYCAPKTNNRVTKKRIVAIPAFWLVWVGRYHLKCPLLFLLLPESTDEGCWYFLLHCYVP